MIDVRGFYSLLYFCHYGTEYQISRHPYHLIQQMIFDFPYSGANLMLHIIIKQYIADL